MTGRFTCPSTSLAGGRVGRYAPGFKMMPNHSPPPGQSPICVALVSGPRIVTLSLPCSLLTTSSQRLAAIERNGCAPSLWERQTRSTKGESDALSSSKIIIARTSLRCETVVRFNFVHDVLMASSPTIIARMIYFAIRRYPLFCYSTALYPKWKRTGRSGSQPTAPRSFVSLQKGPLEVTHLSTPLEEGRRVVGTGPGRHSCSNARRSCRLRGGRFRCP